MDKSESIDKLIAGLLTFHKAVGVVAKNSDNPFFKSKYGDLNAYLEVIKQPLIDAGLVLTQLPITNGLTTMLMHTSGQYIYSTMEMELQKNDPHTKGLALTYMRRYMLAAVLGLNAEDDDGNKASKPEPKSDVKELEKAKIKINEYTSAMQLTDDMPKIVKEFVDKDCLENDIKKIGRTKYRDLNG